MIWLALAGLAAVALAPLALAGRSRLRARRDAALALHRAQLAELDRDLADGRIGPAEHAAARLEVQRRLLRADESAGPEVRPGPVGPLILTAVLVPLAALALYLPSGRPELPAAPLKARLAAAQSRDREARELVGQLRAAIASAKPGSDEARQGNILLGNFEARLGDPAAAAAAWRAALAVQFDPELAVMAAEAQSEADGRVSPASADLFRRALEAAPKDAPWRGAVEGRLADARGPH